MKKSVLIVLVVAGFVWFAGYVWLKHPKPEEEAEVPTVVPVQVGKITRATLRGYVVAYGIVEPEPRGARPAASARVASAVPGVAAAVLCVEGQRVEKGDLLVQLDSRTADVAVAFAEKSLERQKRLMQAEATSQKALEEAEQQLDAARAQLELLSIKAPLAGTVAQVNVKPGEAVDVTTVLAEVIDLDRLVVSANVPSAELPALKTGQATEALPDKAAVRVVVGSLTTRLKSGEKTTAALEDKAASPLTGTLVFISPEEDPKTGTAMVRASVPAGSGLRPGQFVTLRIVSEEHKDCLAAPAESVVKDIEGASVIALVENNKAVQKPVSTGLHEGGLIEVAADGLEPDMVVVTEGAYGLPKETEIKILAK